MVYLIAALIAPVLVLTSFFVLEILAGLRRSGRDAGAADEPAGRAVVVVPAHDEEAVIGETFARLSKEAEGIAEILVVADNCADWTARAARERGATVVERHDSSRKGKGFALAFAQTHLASDPPAIVVVLDADCTIDAESLRRLIANAARRGRPGQAVNLLRPHRTTPLVAMSNFAFMLKNLVRQRGLQRLAGSVHLTGTGMALPWALFDQERLATSSVVEDVKLGIELTKAGKGPVLVADATVWSDPSTSAGTLIQRQRWEGGFIGLALEVAPGLLRDAVASRDPRALCRALDLCVPPVALLVLLNLAVFAITATLTAATSAPWWPVGVQAGMLVAAGLAVLAAWWREGRGFVSFGQLALLPFYLVWKLPLYFGLRHRGSREWLRPGRK